MDWPRRGEGQHVACSCATCCQCVYRDVDAFLMLHHCSSQAVLLAAATGDIIRNKSTAAPPPLNFINFFCNQPSYHSTPPPPVPLSSNSVLGLTSTKWSERVFGTSASYLAGECSSCCQHHRRQRHFEWTGRSPHAGVSLMRFFLFRNLRCRHGYYNCGR